jgi:translation initiation factor 1A
MVKNITGGSNHKKFGRKYTNSAARSNNRLRVSEDEGELYAIVTKMLGNGMFHCLCIDGITRLGHIRGKFSGRGKRDNMVEVGKWVLVGLREWDITDDKMPLSKSAKIQKSDLLEVYSETDKVRLKETVSENWQILDANDASKNGVKDINDYDDVFTFATDREIDRERLVNEMKSSTMEKITLKIGETRQEEDQGEQEINIDDI